MAVHPHRQRICISFLSVIKSFPFLASPSASLGYSCFSCVLFLIFVFHSISFVFSFLGVHFRTVSFFLLAVLCQLLACSSWQFHNSILLVLLPTGPLGLFLCPLPLTSYFGAEVRMHICWRWGCTAMATSQFRETCFLRLHICRS